MYRVMTPPRAGRRGGGKDDRFFLPVSSSSRLPGSPSSLAHAGQVVDVRRLKLETRDVGPRDDLVLLVAQEDPRRLIDDQLLGLVIELGPLRLVADPLRLDQEVIHLGVVIERRVAAPLLGPPSSE